MCSTITTLTFLEARENYRRPLVKFSVRSLRVGLYLRLFSASLSRVRNRAWRSLSVFGATGRICILVPFDVRAERTVIRGEKLPDGTIRHLQPPQYHGDPVNPKRGILCYQTFAWDMLVLLREVGFTDVNEIDYWSMDYGYLGGCCLFVGHKSAAPVTTLATVPVNAGQTLNLAND